MTIEQLKKELGLSQKDLADFFNMNYGSFSNSSAKERYENALCSFYEVAKKAWEEKNIKLNIMKWKVTDPSCNQMMKQLDENRFLFKEDRIVNPETKETETYESEIDLKDYTKKEMFENVRAFGYSFDDMCTWIDEGENLDLIAECIFEMEYNYR